MSSVRIPKQLRQLLADSELEGPTIAFVDTTSRILNDNKLPFFPAYTDHGCEHIERVLDAAVRLIPSEVWDQRLLHADDAAVLTCATALHDLAMHLREPGFVHLVSGSTGFAPLPWFAEPQGDRPADEPWPSLWDAFRKEARHLTKTQLDRLLGDGNAGVPAVAFGERDAMPHPGAWTDADRLLIGEFLRRHHARLAHEIAIYGFPGLSDRDFAPLREQLPQVADAIGVVARSHNELLRTSLAYLSYRHPGDQRPAGAVLPYLMGLLRIADYFQLDGKRAPSLLLHLREPRSPQSLDEWRKHQAVARVSWDHQDPDAVYVEVLPSHGLQTHLQLVELVAGLQRELDVTTAVLSETYGMPHLAPLRLARRRVYTNLAERSLHAQLSFVPRRATLRSAEDLFRLVIHDLYGDAPSVAGRELLQNAVDAVRERRRWEAGGGAVVDDASREGWEDVVVELRETDDGALLRIADRGIGMTPDTVVDHFLAAGASFGPSQDLEEQPDRVAAIRWMKAGRFGVGAFAAFLLGSEIQVRTRHASVERGISFVASLDRELVQLDWADELPVGTEIVVPFGLERLRTAHGPGSLAQLLAQIHRWYVLDDPDVAFRLIDPEGHTTTALTAMAEVPARLPEPSSEWRAVAPEGYDAVLWSTLGNNSGQVSHNGISIGRPGRSDTRSTGSTPPVYEWSDASPRSLLAEPSLAVFDSRHRLGVSLNRYALSSPTLPFEDELLRAIGDDIVAHALAIGEAQHPLGSLYGLLPAFTRTAWVPLYPGLLDRRLGAELCVLWTNGTGAMGLPARRFTGVASVPDWSWSAFPCRVVFGRPGNHDPLSGAAPPRDTEWRAIDLDRGIDVVTQALGWSHVASLVLRSSWPYDFGTGGYGARAEEWSRRPVVQGGLRRVRHTTGNPADAKRLLPLAEELFESAGVKMVGLTLFHTAPGSQRRADPIVAAWDDALSGPLERDPAMRAVRAEEACRRRPQLQTLIEAWRSSERARLMA